MNHWISNVITRCMRRDVMVCFEICIMINQDIKRDHRNWMPGPDFLIMQSSKAVSSANQSGWRQQADTRILGARLREWICFVSYPPWCILLFFTFDLDFSFFPVFNHQGRAHCLKSLGVMLMIARRAPFCSCCDVAGEESWDGECMTQRSWDGQWWDMLICEL